MIVEGHYFGMVFCLFWYIVCGEVPDAMKHFRRLFCLSWGMVLAAIGIGILMALSIPASIIVIILSILLIFVGYCIASSNGKRKF